MLGPLNPVTCKEVALFTVYMGPWDQRQNLTIQKIKIAAKKKIPKKKQMLFHDLFIYIYIYICIEGKMICWGIGRGININWW